MNLPVQYSSKKNVFLNIPSSNLCKKGYIINTHITFWVRGGMRDVGLGFRGKDKGCRREVCERRVEEYG